jgi:hypothetical protein
MEQMVKCKLEQNSFFGMERVSGGGGSGGGGGGGGVGGGACGWVTPAATERLHGCFNFVRRLALIKISIM